MTLNTQIVTADFADMAALAKLNQAAFPADERLPLADMLALVATGVLKVTALYAQTHFVGFYAVATAKSVAYLSLLAIVPAVRGQGLGSQAITLLRHEYHDYQLVLDLEAIEPTATNAVQRVRRNQFYLKNGFVPSGVTLMFQGIAMTVLCQPAPLQVDAFQNIVTWLGQLGYTVQLHTQPS